MKKIFIIILIIVLVLLNAAQFICNNLMHKLFTDAIPDEETAIAVGRAVLLSAYGNMILGQEPLWAFYDERDKCWVVNGHWPDDTDLVGGVGSVIIRKSDGKIMELYHSL